MLDPSRLPLNATTVGFRKRMHLEVDEKAFAFELQRQTDCIKVRREEKETPISEVHVMGGQLFGIGGNSKTNEVARQQRQINGYALRHFSASGPIVLPPKHMDGLLQTPHNVGLTQYVPVGVGVVGGYVSQFTEPNVMHMEEGMAHEKKNLQNEMQQSHEDRQANIMKWDNRRSQAHQNRLAGERMGVRAAVPAQRQALHAQIARHNQQQVQNAPPGQLPLVQHAALNAHLNRRAHQMAAAAGAGGGGSGAVGFGVGAAAGGGAVGTARAASPPTEASLRQEVQKYEREIEQLNRQLIAAARGSTAEQAIADRLNRAQGRLIDAEDNLAAFRRSGIATSPFSPPTPAAGVHSAYAASPSAATAPPTAPASMLQRAYQFFSSPFRGGTPSRTSFPPSGPSPQGIAPVFSNTTGATSPQPVVRNLFPSQAAQANI